MKNINCVLELDDHVAVVPIAIAVLSALKEVKEWRLGLVSGCLSGPPRISIVSSESKLR